MGLILWGFILAVVVDLKWNIKYIIFYI